MPAITLGGFDFTAGECELWLREAGFRGLSATRLADTHTLLVAFK
jgi:hypothetical protein